MKSRLKNKQLVLGITGSLACGKTTVAAMFHRLGAYPVSLDRIYHQLIRPKSSIYKRIVSVFGREILGNNDKIDRKKLGKIVFDSPAALKRLCQITHPAIIKKMRFEIFKLKKIKGLKVIAVEVPLLVETGLIKMFDKIITVKITKKNQTIRCKKQRSIPYNEIIKRVKSQAQQAKKIKLADYVIDNNGTLKQTRKQVKDIWEKITEDREI